MPTRIIDARDPRTPNLFIAGAPKAGTTFLHHALRLAPGVFMSDIKEPGYFLSERDMRRGLGYYLDAYFAHAAGSAIRGESTPWYLYSDLARRSIAALHPPGGTRVVVLVRNPARRALSMYRDQVRLRREHRSFSDAIEAEIRELDRGCVAPDVRRRYVWGGLYTDHIQAWRRDFDTSRVHVVVLEELIAAPVKGWQDLGEFLGHALGPSRLEDVSGRDRNPRGDLRWPGVDTFLRSFEGKEQFAVEAVKRVLPPGTHRRVLQSIARLNRRSADEEEIANEHRDALSTLDAYYVDEIAALERELDRPIDAWRADPNPEGTARTGRSSGVQPTSDRLRVLHVVSRSHRRGAELVAIELADELDGLGHANEVLALGPSTDGGQETGLVPLVGSPGVGLRELVTRAYRIRGLVLGDRFDVVIAHGGWAAQVVAVAAASGRGRAVLAWQRILNFPPQLWRRGRRPWWRLVSRQFDAAVTLTEEMEQELRDLHFEGPIWTIPNARKPDRFAVIDRHDEAARLRAEVGVGPDTRLIGFVGHLVTQKRPDRAVACVASVVRSGVDAHLVLAGEGPLHPVLEAQVAQLGVVERVTFLGHRSDIERVLGGVELLLLTSDAEGIPGVAIESLMAGCPVVSYPVGGVAKVVDDGTTGVVLSRPDAALMSRAVVSLLTDDARRLAMGDAGRRASTRFTSASTAKLYEDGLVELVSTQNRPRRWPRRR